MRLRVLWKTFIILVQESTNQVFVKQSSLLTAGTTKFFASSPLVAEAPSHHEAVSFAANLHLELVIFEADRQVLIEVCKKNIIRHEIQSIIEDIHHISARINRSGFLWTKREGNNCAHTLASLARDNLLHGSSTLRPPPALRRVLVQDAQALWKQL